MGLNTAMMVINDRMDELKADDFGRKLHDAICETAALGRRLGRGTYLPSVDILSSQHADYAQIVQVGGNRIVRVTSAFDEPLAVARAMADALGYRLVRKPKANANSAPAQG